MVSPGANAALDAAVVVADVKDIKADDILPAQLDATIESVEAASEHARARGAATIQHPEMLSTFDFITPNETYAGVLMGDGGRTIASPDDAAHLATSIVALAPRAAILKLGDRG